jgi:glycosyltransferase involved in cell wall biosynthesis
VKQDSGYSFYSAGNEKSRDAFATYGTTLPDAPIFVTVSDTKSSRRSHAQRSGVFRNRMAIVLVRTASKQREGKAALPGLRRVFTDLTHDEDPLASRYGRLISISDYYGNEGPSTGGAGSTALRIADILRAAGVELDVIAGFEYPRARRDEPHVAFMDGSDLREASKTSIRALADGLWNETARQDVRRLLDGVDATRTVLMLHQWTRFLSPSVLAAVSAFPHLVYVHDYFWACPTGTYFNYRTNEPCTLVPGSLRCFSTVCDRVGAAQKGYRVVRHLVKRAVVGQSSSRRVFVHISDRSREFLEPLYPESAHVTVYHSIGTVPVPEPTTLEFDVGYFGRVEPEKGVIELAAAARRTGKSCLFVGSGSRLTELRDRFPEVTIVDWAEGARVFELMRSCRAVVLPSLWRETWGSVVPEALSQSVPVLVSAHAGSSELISKFGGGIVFDPASPASFDAALLRVLADREDLARAAGRAFVAAGLGEAAYIRSIVNLVRDQFGIELVRPPASTQAALGEIDPRIREPLI